MRHNRVRDVAFEDACEARMSPEREKPGLLPSRPHEDGIHCDSHGEARRPADVWLPRGMSSTSGRPEALDFAVTCGLTSDKVWKSAESPHVLFEDYCDFKRQYKDTGQLCSNQGLVFTPLVFEAHGGGFGPDVLRIFDAISKRQASSGFRCREGNSLRIAQRVSTAIHMANSRAILKRLPSTSPRMRVPDLGAADEGA